MTITDGKEIILDKEVFDEMKHTIPDSIPI